MSEQPIRCDRCGRFIAYDDIIAGKATHIMKTPDSDVSYETWESLCRACLSTHHSINTDPIASLGMGSCSIWFTSWLLVPLCIHQ
jgi:hypothetical protein